MSEVTAVTHLEKVITGKVSAVTHLEKVIAEETTAVTYTEKVITGEVPPITHLQKVIAGEVQPVTHLEHIWAGGTPTPTEHEYTGAVPYTFTADGTPLIDWYIKGNMQQSGTPTPSSPIQPSETGDLETTGAHAGQYKIPISSANTTIPVYLGEVETTRNIKKLVLTGEETWVYESEYTRFYISFPNSLILGVRATPAFCTHFQVISDGRPISEVPNNAIYSNTDTPTKVWFFKVTDYTTVADFKTYLQQQYAAGTPVTVWYVLTTEETGIVNEPIRKIGDYADTLTATQAGVEIPTNNGSTTLDVDTTLKPSEVYIKYMG